MTRHFATALLSLSLFVTACAPHSPSITPPPGPSNVVLALDAIEIACAASVPDVSLKVAAWLQTCPVIVTATVKSLQSRSAISTASIVTAGMNQFLAAAPATALSPDDVQVIRSITGAVNAFLQFYGAQTTAFRATDIVPVKYTSSFRVMTQTLSTADKRMLAETRKHADGAAKRIHKRLHPGGWWKNHVGPVQGGPVR